MRAFDHLVAFPPYVSAVRKVGTGTTWRLGKKMLGMTVPMRFHAGEPFHAGLGWQTMEVGLKGMSAVLAD
ncbi:MAG TPA: hypothetical protein VHJ37_14100 [Thermoleophilaceae bacterium]|jgi:sulfide:quinone oxidoreductase|nr:hypothetical protein [Thermoleophilaceae bacterium]